MVFPAFEKGIEYILPINLTMNSKKNNYVLKYSNAL